MKARATSDDRRPPRETGSEPRRSKAAATEVVELKGHRTFDPSAALSEFFDWLLPRRASFSARVRFGALG